MENDAHIKFEMDLSGGLIITKMSMNLDDQVGFQIFLAMALPFFVHGRHLWGFLRFPRLFFPLFLRFERFFTLTE